jgi:hypothetical protein
MMSKTQAEIKTKENDDNLRAKRSSRQLLIESDERGSDKSLQWMQQNMDKD